MTLTVRFGKDDHDLARYFDSLAEGSKSEKAKELMRRGLAVEGIDLLQLLVEKGIINTLEVAVANGRNETRASQEQEEEFAANVMSSWD